MEARGVFCKYMYALLDLAKNYSDNLESLFYTFSKSMEETNLITLNSNLFTFHSFILKLYIP